MSLRSEVPATKTQSLTMRWRSLKTVKRAIVLDRAGQGDNLSLQVKDRRDARVAAAAAGEAAAADASLASEAETEVSEADTGATMFPRGAAPEDTRAAADAGRLLTTMTKKAAREGELLVGTITMTVTRAIEGHQEEAMAATDDMERRIVAKNSRIGLLAGEAIMKAVLLAEVEAASEEATVDALDLGLTLPEEVMNSQEAVEVSEEVPEMATEADITEVRRGSDLSRTLGQKMRLLVAREIRDNASQEKVDTAVPEKAATEANEEVDTVDPEGVVTALRETMDMELQEKAVMEAHERATIAVHEEVDMEDREEVIAAPQEKAKVTLGEVRAADLKIRASMATIETYARQYTASEFHHKSSFSQ